MESQFDFKLKYVLSILEDKLKDSEFLTYEYVKRNLFPSYSSRELKFYLDDLIYYDYIIITRKNNVRIIIKGVNLK